MGDSDFCGALNFYNRDKSSPCIYIYTQAPIYTHIYIDFDVLVAHKTSLDIVLSNPPDFLPFLNISPETTTNSWTVDKTFHLIKSVPFFSYTYNINKITRPYAPLPWCKLVLNSNRILIKHRFIIMCAHISKLQLGELYYLLHIQHFKIYLS